jgi:hypothetical protein
MSHALVIILAATIVAITMAAPAAPAVAANSKGIRRVPPRAGLSLEERAAKQTKYLSQYNISNFKKRPANASIYSKDYKNSTQLRLEAGIETNRPAHQLEKIARRDMYNHAPTADPYGFLDGSMNIILTWNTGNDGGYDLDLLVMDPTGCVAAAKSDAAGFCYYDPGWMQMGGSINAVVVTQYPYEGANYEEYSPPMDTNGDTYCCINGVEEILIWNPDTSGEYKVVVYQYGDPSGFAETLSATVMVWFNNAENWPEVVRAYYVYDTPYYGNDCQGRFWNVFSVSFTMSADDDHITGYTLTTKMILTSTPEVSFGTTDWFQWEISPRTSALCDTFNYYYYY